MSDAIGTIIAIHCWCSAYAINMVGLMENIWHEGFVAGDKYLHECPYPSASDEANVWHAGWVEGILKSHGCAYRDKPLDLEGGESIKGLIRW